MKNLLLFFLLIIALTFPINAFAHVLVTDNSIGAVIHIDPDDDPIAKEKSTFIFDFKDKTNRLDLSLCSCDFHIVEDGKTIYSQPLSNDGGNKLSSSVSYTFPKKDIYTVKIIGKPLQSSQFQSFVLSYDVRVSRESNTNSENHSSDAIFISIILLASICIIGIYIFKKVRR